MPKIGTSNSNNPLSQTGDFLETTLAGPPDSMIALGYLLASFLALISKLTISE